MSIQPNSDIVKSPCIKQCRLNQRDICIGCYRSISEIVGWAEKSITEQKNIIKKSLHRKAKDEQRSF